MRPTPLIAILAAQLVLSPALTAAPPARKPVVAKQAPDNTTSLPVTRVSLYKNGVGFFEHTGHVSGNADVSIDFTTAQLNDVLQSLTAIDLNGGRISGAGYNSTTPLEQQLKTLPLALGEDTTAADFYAAIRGARVEVRAANASISGRLLSVEDRSSAAKSDDAGSALSDRHFITVVSETGEVRTLELTPSTSVRLLDPALHQDVTRYLQLLAGNRSKGLRHLTLNDRGSGTRELRVSYISEVPIWKSTYRILFTDATNASTHQATLQGWAVVDNTVGEDWTNVQLSLIAGAPQSFIQPLSDPIYSRRPEIPLVQDAQLMPQTFESGFDAGQPGAGVEGRVLDASGASIPNAHITVINSASGAQSFGNSDNSGAFSIPLAQPGQYILRVSTPGFQTLSKTVAVSGQNFANANLNLSVGSASESVMVESSNASVMGRNLSSPVRVSKQLPKALRGSSAGNTGYGAGSAGGVFSMAAPAQLNYQMAAAASLTPDTRTNAFDDFFEYKITEPITIRKNESALVPILQHKIDADRVTLASYRGSVSQPLRALWIRNTTDLTLDRGSFALIENGNFAGEGLLDPIHANERRLLSYAADQAVHISAEGDRNSSRNTRITASRGVLQVHRADTHEVTFVIHNSAADHRSVVIEVPVVAGWELDSELKPSETTGTVYRFRSEVDSAQTVRLRIGAHRDESVTYSLTNADDNQFTYIVNSSNRNAAFEQAIEPILESRRRLADAQTALDQTTEKLDALHTEEERQRANITALTAADKGSRDRFVHDLNATEDQIKALQAELTSRTRAVAEARADLAKRIESLEVNEKL